MSGKCTQEKCSLCTCNFQDKRHRHISSDRNKVCYVSSCSSTDIEVYRHAFSWGDVCNSIDPVNHLLCSKHYQQVYRMLNVVSKACVCCGVKRRHKHSATSSVQFVTCPDPRRVDSYDRDQVCYPCYKFFNQKLKSSECMLSNED